ncbi:unnamed protein product [Linum trigynum]|uniref:DUF4283 domain protein n=1 Tax=Linum trigynum TaxID=586398 RepID=A0AAV2G5Z6_9ROSI
MTVDAQPSEMESDHCLKPPDGSSASSPVQPSKKAKAWSSEGFSGQGEMDFAVITATNQSDEVRNEKTTPSEEDNQESKDEKQGPIRSSYKDSVIGNHPSTEEPEGDDLMSDESEQEDGDDDPDCPTIWIKKRTNSRIQKRWNRAITFRVLGKNFPFAFTQRRIQKMWAKTGQVKVGDIGNVYCQAIFDTQLDHDRALYGGP